MSQKSMIMVKGVTARKLLQQSNREIIKNIVQDEVKRIDAKIQTAHAAGFNHIEHELPSTFNINNLDKADAQTMIYSEILAIYKTPEPDGKGFDEVYIDPSGLVSYLHIYWLNGMDESERDRRRELIKSCSRKIVSKKTDKY